MYAVTATSRIHAFDLTSPTNSRKVIVEETKNFIYERIYITQTPSRELLLVWRDQELKVKGDVDCDPLEFMEGTRKITVYKVDVEAKELVEINSLHDHVLLSDSVEEIMPPRCSCSWPAPIWITPNLTNMSSRLREQLDPFEGCYAIAELYFGALGPQLRDLVGVR
ncbi:hypothetical protein C2845_PM17G11850 [Panicum miliaceum]|uniref:KIB1-4 beta-propeller domain-containing protein n=1 Tax=Panicum miliaceum TaxID=4540 RepID=A0A3L6Q4U0_PANMI|nr:hypothetical protein C2845_PM17G11850 [Panicum miliaceum]